MPAQSQEVISGGRYLSADDPMRVFAAGSMTNKMAMEITWRSGSQTRIDEVLPNHIYEIDEATSSVSSRTATAEPVSPSPKGRAGVREKGASEFSSTTPLFDDVSSLISHTNQDTPFNDFEREPLLYRSLSQLGPGIGWFDLDGDGHDDLIIPSGKGGTLAAYKSDGKGNFSPWSDVLWKEPSADDQSCAVGWTPSERRRSILLALSRYESLEETIVLERIDLPPSPVIGLKLPMFTKSVSPGPLALADLDGDGDLDLFIGGRVLPARYPEPASSQIYKNTGGQLELDEANSALLKDVGLVSGAVFSDLDGDGFPELILACEWGPIRIFRNHAGELIEVTEKLGFNKFIGWWNGINTGDFDGDGKLDIVASNWGLNSSYHRPTPENPVRTYYGDFDGNGTVELIEAYTDSLTGRIVPRRDLLAMTAAMPSIRDRFPTHAAYAAADVMTILGPNAASARQVQVNMLATLVFLNRGDHFEPVILPDEAQFSPAFGINISDFDGDGFEDIFFSQNFFGVRAEEHRLDAGRGLLLRGNGKGQFTAVPGQDSGIKIYGEQRGSAVCDYDEDGRIDLAVTQNSAQTKLYHNLAAKPGLRIRLAGPPANPSGVGAAVRLKFPTGWGPAREIHAGSGYCSQDSAVQVMSLAQTAIQIEVRWPGGKTTTSDVPAEAKEIAVDPAGKVTRLR